MQLVLEKLTDLTYHKDVFLREKTCQKIAHDMRSRKETSDPTKCCSPVFFFDNICLPKG